MSLIIPESEWSEENGSWEDYPGFFRDTGHTLLTNVGICRFNLSFFFFLSNILYIYMYTYISYIHIYMYICVYIIYMYTYVYINIKHSFELIRC